MYSGRIGWHKLTFATVALHGVAAVVCAPVLVYLATTGATGLWAHGGGGGGEEGGGGGAYRTGLLLRTLAYAGLAGVLATGLAVPVARVLAGSGGRLSRPLLLAAVPATLVIPSMVYAYGGQQVLRLAGISLDPGSAADVARCIVTLAAWMWGIPAILLALAWRRLDPHVLQQARLDGVERRITARLLAGPAMAGVCISAAIGSQEFGIFETTGIAVAATEVRTVFDTGVFLGSAGGSGQAGRAAGAVAVGMPTLLATLGLFGAGLVQAWRLVLPPSGPVESPGTVCPRSGLAGHALAWAVVGLTLGAPTAALVLSLADPAPPWTWLEVFRPQIGGTLLMGALGLVAAAGLGVLGTLARPWVPLGLGLLTFLVGGLFVGIALVRVYNRPGLMWVYDSSAVTVLAYLARFGWVALLAAALAHTPSADRLREMAAMDGAGPIRTLWGVLLPRVGGGLLAGATAVGLLAMGEVPATMLVAPPSPPLLTPLLLTWVHMQRYDPMIQACLLLVGMASLAAVLGLAVRVAITRRLA